MNEDRFAFNRGAIRPLQCLSEGWQLIKTDYWFFLGVTFVGVMVAQLAPMGILLGPAMCGIHICLLRQMNGQRVTFDMLFQGFNYFGPGFVATIFMMVPIFLIILLYYVFTFGGLIGFAVWADAQPRNAGRDDAIGFALLGWVLLTTLILIVVMATLQALYLFVFPLIVDRELSGWEAVKTSFRGVLGNLGGVVALVFLETLLGLGGMLLCYFGVIFVIPLSFAMTAVAFRQVFPAIDPFEDHPIDPEPPAPRVLDHDTGVQSHEPRSSGFRERPDDANPSEQP